MTDAEILTRLEGPWLDAYPPDALCHAAADLIERLQAEKAEMEKDAARYRWLRLPGHNVGISNEAAENAEVYDAAIDRAMTKSHASDCAVHNAPAYPPGPCDCAALEKP